MSSLPVAAVVPELVTALREAPQTLLVAPTGAGKSTWLPLALLKEAAVTGKILLLEPRRLAARNVAERLAEQLGEKPGTTVGYRMRAESCGGPDTRIDVITEGILTRMLQQDPELSGVGLVILDEFHERSLQADLALALLLDVQQGLREDLKLLIMSATLDDQRLSQRLPQAPVVISQGRSFPVSRRYLPLAAQARFEESVAAAASKLLKTESGSMLVFLPGVAEIQRVQQQLASHVAADVLLCPLYGALPLSAQRQAIAPPPPGLRKVVLATNIAETSLTIEGIRLVVDCALERSARFDPRTGITRLVTASISQASMTQRAGRAGRLEPGICLHLLSADRAERAAAQGEPEISQSDLAGLVMELAQWGCPDPAQLIWLDLPPAPALDAGRQLLKRLGALDDQLQLTALGRQMAKTGLEPRLAAMLCQARGADEQATAAALIARLEEPERGREGSLDTALGRRLPHWQQRSRQLLQRIHQSGGQVDAALAATVLVRGFADRLARKRGTEERYQLANGCGATLSRDSELAHYPWLIAPALLQGNQSPDARILQALPVDIDALTAASPQLLTCSDTVEWLEDKGTLTARRRWQIGELTLRSQVLAKPDQEVLHAAMLTGIRERGLGVLNWSAEASQLRARLQCARAWLPEQAWPDVSEEALLAILERWLLPEMTGVKSLQALRQVDLARALGHLVDWSQRARLDSALPTHYTVPTGSRIAIRYAPDAQPVLAVRVQEMYGEAQTPSVAEGRTPLVLELLSPAQRPLQITRDLAAFWQGAWREVQKEMKGRYPKHLWPDDPANTAPTRRVKKYQ